ncbi:hypothetical protein BJY24_005697 [Nocardia transvalensis]|uniref:Uncharacterized protein n=1 Tax=Nocardia transvalensis TaxID=37333 RepID=A0A7W9ULJ9_9NOCA|nr:hypothetical protein [Nocardia transvalensis]MBB5916785.1 hypothetical protein [Nocardia transvalensis]
MPGPARPADIPDFDAQLTALNHRMLADVAQRRIARLLAGQLPDATVWNTLCVIAGIPGYSHYFFSSVIGSRTYLSTATARAGTVAVIRAVTQQLGIEPEYISPYTTVLGKPTLITWSIPALTHRALTLSHAPDPDIHDPELRADVERHRAENLADPTVYTVELAITRGTDTSFFYRTRGHISTAHRTTDPDYEPSHHSN